MHKNIKGKITSSSIHNYKLEKKLEPLFLPFAIFFMLFILKRDEKTF